MLKVFIGHEPRLAIQTNVCISSVYEAASQPVAVTPLVLRQLPLSRVGLTEFSFSRFLVPWLCGFQGWALFMDSDIIVTGDVAELFTLADDQYAVQICDIKPEFERAAVMLFNCGHPDNRKITPEWIDAGQYEPLHLIRWTDKVGYIPANWGHAVGYAKPQPIERLSLCHYTAGVPVWPETADCEHAEEWHKARRQMCSVKTNWPDLIGRSVHAALGPDGQPLPKWKVQGNGTLDEG